MDVIRMDEEANKAIIKYQEDCMLCDFCVLDCPEEAIYVSPEKHAPLIVSWG
jgi:NAD-dependent dihydropyrimidine dehydrogenase PreA subunit